MFRRFSHDKVVETHNEEKGGQTKKIKTAMETCKHNLNLGVTTSKLEITIEKEEGKNRN